MKNRCIVLCLLILVFVPTIVCAQGRRHMSRGFHGSQRDCLSTADLELTNEQRGAIKIIEGRYGDQINQLQNRLMGKRLEIQQAFRDPRADEGTIRAKAVEISDLQNQCRQMMLDYQLAVRALLSPVQLRSWCGASMEPCFMRGRGRPW